MTKKVETTKRKRGQPEIYTIDWAVREAQWMLDYIKNDDKGKSILFESELNEIRDYSRQRWSECKSKYSDIVRKEDELDEDYRQRLAKSKQFVDLVERISSILHNRLVKGGLVKKFDSAMTRFMLFNIHDYSSEKTESKVEMKITEPVPQSLKDELENEQLQS